MADEQATVVTEEGEAVWLTEEGLAFFTEGDPPPVGPTASMGLVFALWGGGVA